MTGLTRSDKIREELIKEAEGSFSRVRRALEEAARARKDKSQPLDLDDVKRRIQESFEEKDE